MDVSATVMKSVVARSLGNCTSALARALAGLTCVLTIAFVAGPGCDCGGQVPGSLVDADTAATDAPGTGGVDAQGTGGGGDGAPVDSGGGDVDAGPPAGKIVISEVLAYPINDWDQSSGGGAPYQVPPGTGFVSSLDEYVELHNWGPGVVDMSDWTLEVIGSVTRVTVVGEDGETAITAGSALSALQPGDFLVIGNPAGSISSDAFIVLRDPYGRLIDDVEIGGLTPSRDREGDGLGDGAPTPDRNGFARGAYEESIARLDGAADSGDDQADFTAMVATPLQPNIAPPPPIESVPPTVVASSSGDPFAVTSLLRIELDEKVAPLSTDPEGVVSVTADGQPIELGFTTFEDDDHTIVINPIGRLPFDSDIVVTIRGGVGGVTDRAGNPLPGDHQFAVHTEAAPSDPGAVVLNEICASPVQDWNSGTSGDSMPFSDTPGNGLITPSDEWIELYVSAPGPFDLSNYELVLYNGPTFYGPSRQATSMSSTYPVFLVLGSTTDMTSVIQGDRVVVGNPDGVIHSNTYITLRDGTGQLIDEVEIGGVSADTDRGGDGVDNGAPAPGESGVSTGLADESVARVPDGSDSGDDIADFSHDSATIGTAND